MPQIPHLEAQILDVSQTRALSLRKHRLPGNAETWSPVLWHWAKNLVNSVSLIKTGKKQWNLGTHWAEEEELFPCAIYLPGNQTHLLERASWRGGSWVPLSHSLLFCAQQRGARAPGSLVFTCQWLLSVSTAGAPCLSLGPGPKQSKMVWLFTEISHPVSKRKFKR